LETRTDKPPYLGCFPQRSTAARAASPAMSLSPSMKSLATAEFWQLYARLPEAQQRDARKAYQLWQRNPHHGSLHFKKAGRIWSDFFVRGESSTTWRGVESRSSPQSSPPQERRNNASVRRGG